MRFNVTTDVMLNVNDQYFNSIVYILFLNDLIFVNDLHDTYFILSLDHYDFNHLSYLFTNFIHSIFSQHFVMFTLYFLVSITQSNWSLLNFINDVILNYFNDCILDHIIIYYLIHTIHSLIIHFD